jgi:hypothetical protein
MPPQYKYRSLADSSGPSLTETDLTDYFRLYTLDVAMNAEEGSVAQSTVFADDPDGDLDVTGHRRFRITESTATGSNTTIWVGYTAARRYHRGDSTRTGVARAVDIDLVDVNSILARRIFDRSQANRPAETDVARITWLLTTEETQLIDDDTFFSTANAVAMDAVDYRGQSVENVLNDCAQQSGKNYFIWYNDDTNQYSLFYDFADAEVYTSPLRLTNVASEVDNSLTFAISIETELSRSPDRVYSGAYLEYDGGTVYEQKTATANNFARRDAVMPAENVKTQAKATARAQRYLNDMDSEEDVITTSVILPAAKVNFLMQGMRVQFKATHLPGYDSYTYLRLLNRSVRQLSEEFYEVKCELSSAGAAGEPGVTCDSPYDETEAGFYPPINSVSADADAVVYYFRTGDPLPEQPDPDYVGNPNFFESGAGGSPDYLGDCAANTIRVLVVGDGTLAVETATYGGGPRNLNVALRHRTTGAPDPTTDETDTGVTGDTFTFNVSTHGGTECIHWVDITDDGPGCGGKFGFAGATWTPT